LSLVILKDNTLLILVPYKRYESARIERIVMKQSPTGRSYG